GLPTRGAASSARLILADFLDERSADGRRWGLVVDEVQLARAEVLEEIRVLSNRLARPDGFVALVLIGQTPLLRQLATRPMSALEARLAARVPLRAIDADEARLLLIRHGLERGPAETNEWHRSAAGNPQRLLRIARVGAATRPAVSRSEVPAA